MAQHAPAATDQHPLRAHIRFPTPRNAVLFCHVSAPDVRKIGNVRLVWAKLLRNLLRFGGNLSTECPETYNRARCRHIGAVDG